jgi:ABC-type nitrate/sulfonate/bicarbonate transport system substrate-binding protein
MRSEDEACTPMWSRAMRENDKNRRDRASDYPRFGAIEMRVPLRIGFIPLVDAAALFVAADKGFFRDEGLEVELVREASWSNIRDRLALGHYDAAHFLAPMAVASTLGLGHLKTPIVAPLNLAMNGNAITVSHALFAQLADVADGDIADPAVSARALGIIVEQRAERGIEPLAFGMTFPFSTHNYQLRYWLAEGGVDPDEDVRLIVLPPQYMAQSLSRGQVDGFCVGAPWNSVAVDAGVGAILHFGCEIFSPAPEKVLALRAEDVAHAPARAMALVRACARASAFVADRANHDEASVSLARPDRVGASREAIKRTLDGVLRIDAAQHDRANSEYLLFGVGASARPDPEQAAWIYAQMLRWRQLRHTAESLEAAKQVFRPDRSKYGASVADPKPPRAFSGPIFSSQVMEAYLDSFSIGARLGAAAASPSAWNFGKAPPNSSAPTGGAGTQKT